MNLRTDCKHYIGEKPCKARRLCNDCPRYESRGITILILKLGAMGDALRTTPLLKALKRKFSCSYITWITDSESYSVLEHNHLIDELLINHPESVLPLMARRFDLLICLDKHPTVTSLAVCLDAAVKKGFSMTRYGTLDIFNESSRYSLALGLDDNLKFFQNKKTYQEIVYEMADLPYMRDEYIFNLPDEPRTAAIRIIESLKTVGTGPKIGLNTGCGNIFATKKWPDSHFLHLIRLLKNHLNARIYLLGGTAEIQTNDSIASESGFLAVNAGSHTIPVFAGLLNQMDVVVTGDTMALHLALAVGTSVVGLFGPTCYQEIDFYDRGEPVIIQHDCSPCYRKHCRHNISCMSFIKPETVFDVVKKYVVNREY